MEQHSYLTMYGSGEDKEQKKSIKNQSKSWSKI